MSNTDVKEVPLPAKASWLEINPNALKANIQSFRNLLPPTTRLGVVLKGNAYGHGLNEVLPIIQPWVDCLYVITAAEAFQIRALEKKQGLSERQVLVLGALSLEEVIACARQSIEVVIGDNHWKDFLLRIKAAQVKLKAHLHLDTGLGREGFAWDEVEKELSFLKGSEATIQIQGCMSHFANTEDATEHGYARLQMNHFRQGTDRAKAFLGIHHPIEEHFAASAASLVLSDSRMSIIRLGISLFGFWPSLETEITARAMLDQAPELIPALTWKCVSQLVKPVKKGSYIGYGCTYRCEQDSWIAVFPVGYYDGYPRLMTGKCHVLIQGKRCPVIGRIMMNHIIVDVTSVITALYPQSNPPEPFDLQAILMGSDGKQQIPAEMLADWAQTIHYEVTTHLGAHLNRKVV